MFVKPDCQWDNGSVAANYTQDNTVSRSLSLQLILWQKTWFLVISIATLTEWLHVHGKKKKMSRWGPKVPPERLGRGQLRRSVGAPLTHAEHTATTTETSDNVTFAQTGHDKCLNATLMLCSKKGSTNWVTLCILHIRVLPSPQSSSHEGNSHVIPASRSWKGSELQCPPSRHTWHRHFGLYSHVERRFYSQSRRHSLFATRCQFRHLFEVC